MHHGRLAARWLNASGSEDAAALSAQQGRQPAVMQSETVLTTDASVLDIRPLPATLLAWPDGPDKAPAAAAWFHLMLAEALADWAAHAARQADCRTVCLGGGCFMNAILTREVTARLESLGLRVLRPQITNCGDAGLALGQAWVVAQQLNQSKVHHHSLDSSKF